METHSMAWLPWHECANMDGFGSLQREREWNRLLRESVKENGSGRRAKAKENERGAYT